MDKTELRKVEVLRDNKWIEVRLKEVKKGEIFKLYEGNELIGNCEWKATADGYLWYISKDIGGIEAVKNEENRERRID
jgi:hypothetical protein